MADQLYLAHFNIHSLNPSLLELRHDLDTRKPDILSKATTATTTGRVPPLI